MRIKSVRTTNEYSEIEMGELVGRANAAVLGPVSGSADVEFKKVKNFGKIKTGPTVTIRHDGGTLRCDPEHRILTNRGELFAKDISPETDTLVGLGNQSVEFSKTTGIVRDLYDLEIDEPHLYFTSGIVSHNSIWLCNNSINSVVNGYDTLHITFEMSAFKTARRCLGALTDRNMRKFHEEKEIIRGIVGQTYTTSKAKLAIYEMPPGD